MFEKKLENYPTLRLRRPTAKVAMDAMKQQKYVFNSGKACKDDDIKCKVNRVNTFCSLRQKLVFCVSLHGANPM